MSITYFITGTSKTNTLSGVSPNHVFLTDSGGAGTALTIKGSAALYASFDVIFVCHLNTINASTDNGGIVFNLPDGILKSTFTFTDGSDVDLLAIRKASLDSLISVLAYNKGANTYIAIDDNTNAVRAKHIVEGVHPP